MFFNSFNKRMKKVYLTLDIHAKEIVFPNGESEFLYVTTLLNNNFNNKDLVMLLPIYGSIKTFILLEKGNYNYIFDYSRKKMTGFSDEDVFTMISIAMSTTLTNNNFKDTSNTLMEQCKKSIKSALNTILQINNHLDIFGTKNDKKIGTIDNPILLPGFSGVEKYFYKLVTKKNEEIYFKRTNCMYLTDNKTNINYVLDEYEIYVKDTNEKICSLFINEYGISECKYYPKELKLKKAIQNDK